jgi:hypothetical protein
MFSFLVQIFHEIRYGGVPYHIVDTGGPVSRIMVIRALSDSIRFLRKTSACVGLPKFPCSRVQTLILRRLLEMSAFRDGIVLLDISFIFAKLQDISNLFCEVP